MEAGTS